MSILKSGVGFLLLAVIITLTVFYFNRGKDVTVKHIDGVLNAVEGVNINAIDLTSYDGEDIQGSAVISMVESLTNSTANVNVLVYTNKETDTSGNITYNTVSEYTQSGPNASFTLADLDDINNVYVLSSERENFPDMSSVAKAGKGDYRVKTSEAYINPTSYYNVNCHYTANGALAFVVITQK